MKKFFDHIDEKMVKFLSRISFLSLMVVGLVIVFFLFREIYSMVTMAFQADSSTHYYEVLQSILSFFIFFEFLTLIITSIRNKGHVSLIFLLSLGITSLIRVLLTYHDQLIGLIAISSSILLLIIGVVVLKRFIFTEDKNEEHL
ncbi:phosphate-starvation-inducible protein PsiE [Lactococcus protaetiae]|uniref:Protein PsiE n=1 Tax=Lactococcus protaetiae TaxID=2592653 RepID=A0A514Z8U6_9LACT|nr:phosphate-starvation-inducible protein PsiE [Lactococcus protaetiae]QDK71020.1 phosphate-starvation-inducible protein PsiE [Lactococcus protaetiae]